MSGTPKQRASFQFLRARKGRPFSTDDLATAANYTRGTAGTHLSEHWAAVVERHGKKWKTRPLFRRMTFEEFRDAISQSKAVAGPRADRLYLLLDASALVPYYLPASTKHPKLAQRSAELIDSVRNGNNTSFLYVPNFCVAETFSVFMKHRFSDWNQHVEKRIRAHTYHSAVARFRDDIHNGKLIYQYELNRYHILGVNLVAPVDHHYQMMRPKRRSKARRRNPTPAGTFDQMIVSMGVQLAHLHGAANTVVVTADSRLASLVEKCRELMKPEVRRKLGLDRSWEIVGRPFRPETFPNSVNLQTAAKGRASDFTGCRFSV